MNFSEVMFYENYLTSEFPYKHCVCLLVNMASKIVIRPILLANTIRPKKIFCYNIVRVLLYLIPICVIMVHCGVFVNSR